MMIHLQFVLSFLLIALHKVAASCLNQTDAPKDPSIWKMAQQFGNNHNVKGWDFHLPTGENIQMNTILHQLMKETENTGYFRFLRFNRKKEYLDDVNNKSNNVMTLHVHFHQHSQPLANIVDDEIMDPINLGSKFNVWLVQLPDNATKSTIIDYLTKFKLGYQTNFYCFSFFGVRKIRIYDAYKIHDDAKVTLKEYGTWSCNNGLRVSNQDIWSRREDLEGFHFKVVSAFSPPSVTYIEDQCTSEHCFKGMYADIWHSLSKKMNFSYTISREYAWGSFDNGSWNGMVGTIAKEDADIACTDLAITKERSTAVDFLSSFQASDELLFLRNPVDSFSTNAYVGSFSVNSWIAICIWIIVVPLLVFLFLYSGDFGYKNQIKLYQCYILVIESLALLSKVTIATRCSIRIMFTTIIIVGMMIHFHWDAELISHLATRKIVVPFRNLDELLHRERHHLVVGRGTVYVDRFRYAHDHVRNKIWKEQIQLNVHEFPLYQDLFQYLLNDPLSVAYMDSAAKSYVDYVECNIIDTGVTIQKAKLAWAIQKNSQFYSTFDYHIKRLKEIGSVQRFYEKYAPERQSCPDYSGNPIAMTQCFVAFKILAAGLTSSVCFFMIERFLPRRIKTWISSLIYGSPLKTPMGNKKKSTASKYLAPKSGRNFVTDTRLQKSKKNLERRKMIVKYRENSIRKQLKILSYKRSRIFHFQIERHNKDNQLIEMRRANAKLIFENHILKANRF